MNNRNYQTFVSAYTVVLRRLYETDHQDYLYCRTRNSAESLAERMTAGLAAIPTSANKDGAACKEVCKLLGIKHTYKAIGEYLRTKD